MPLALGRPGFVALAAVLLGVAACSDGREETADPEAPLLSVALDTLRLHHTSDEPLLASPVSAFEGRDGLLYVADASDRDIKIYDGTGRRVRVLGRSGRGPGEFSALMVAQPYRDSLVSFDMVGRRLNVVAPDGSSARALTVEPAGFAAPGSVRVLDDSLFLTLGTALQDPTLNLLAILRTDGTRVRTMMDPSGYLDGDRELAAQTFTHADGRDGVVFATLSGSDSLHAFDYDGRRLASALVDPHDPLPSMRALVRRNGGRMKGAGGEYVQHGQRMVFGLVALDGARVALQVARYDARAGTDVMEGGTLLVYELEGRRLRLVARAPVGGALLGRSQDGSPLVLSYEDSTATAYRAHVVRLQPASAR